MPVGSFAEGTRSRTAAPLPCVGKQAFVGLQMAAVGTRWGHTELNGRRRDPEPGPVGFVFELAPASPPPTAPAFIRNHDVPRVSRPGTR
jgi:hypothetical protein